MIIEILFRNYKVYLNPHEMLGAESLGFGLRFKSLVEIIYKDVSTLGLIKDLSHKKKIYVVDSK